MARGTACIENKDNYLKQVLNARNKFIKTITNLNLRAPKGFYTSVIGILIQDWPTDQVKGSKWEREYSHIFGLPHMTDAPVDERRLRCFADFSEETRKIHRYRDCEDHTMVEVRAGRTIAAALAAVGSTEGKAAALPAVGSTEGTTAATMGVVKLTQSGRYTEDLKMVRAMLVQLCNYEWGTGESVTYCKSKIQNT